MRSSSIVIQLVLSAIAATIVSGANPTLAATETVDIDVAKPASTPPGADTAKLTAEIMREYKWTGEWTYNGSDKEFTEAANLPVHCWLPVGQPPRLLVLAIHGLTLHGKTYEILGRGFASAGAVFVAPDMRGYGLNSKLDNSDERSKINNAKSYEDIVRLAKAMRKRYPDIQISALGESLGTSFVIKLAAEHPELVNEVIVAAPTSKVNPLMMFHPATVAEGVAAIFRKGHKMSYKVFFNSLVSDEPQILDELAADPLVRKDMPLKALLETQRFVRHTDKWAKKIKNDAPILVLQGSKDKAMVPRAVVELTKNINSTDQTIRWMTGYSHLLLETRYLRPASLAAIVTFIDSHAPDDETYKKTLYGEMLRLGATELRKTPN